MFLGLVLVALAPTTNAAAAGSTGILPTLPPLPSPTPSHRAPPPPTRPPVTAEPTSHQAPPPTYATRTAPPQPAATATATDVGGVVPLTLAPTPTPTHSTHKNNAAGDSTAHRLNVLIALVLGFAALLGLSGGVGLYLTREAK